MFSGVAGAGLDSLSMDGVMTKAPLGEEQNWPHFSDRSTSGVTRSLLAEGHRLPIGLTIEGANRHERKWVRPTIERLAVERPEPSEEHPQGMCLNKGYDDDEVRDILRKFGLTAPLRPRGEEAKAIKQEAGFLSKCARNDEGWPRVFRLKIQPVRPPKNANNKVLPNLLAGRVERDSARCWACS